MNNRDAMRSVMARVPAADVKFVDPILDMFFEDERAGLCTIEIKRLKPFVAESIAELGRVAEHCVQVRYLDPEVAMMKRLSI
jgi:hypothetical protein